MPWTYTLTGGGAILSLNDLTNYAIEIDGFSAPPPPIRRAVGGQSLLRDGAVITARAYDNRVVTIRLQIKGSSRDNLKANVQAIHDLLERTAEYTLYGIGSQTTLVRQWDGATYSETFNVLDGALDLGEAEMSILHRNAYRLHGVVLSLTCEPFAYGATETIQNYLADPSFEVAGTPLANWLTEGFADGVGNAINRRTTTEHKWGLASLWTGWANAGIVSYAGGYQDIAVSPGEVWSIGVWKYLKSKSGNAYGMIKIQWLDAGGAHISWAFTATYSVVDPTWTLVKIENKTAPALAAYMRIIVRAHSETIGNSISCYFDNLIAVKAATLPTAWASGRSIVNHFDDDGQAHLNYLDVYNTGGDVPADVQYKLTEVQTHDTHWDGARHAARLDDAGIWTEGASFTYNAINTPADWAAADAGNIAAGTYSDGTSRRCTLTRTGADGILSNGTYFRMDFNVTTPPPGQYRVLVRVGWISNDADPVSEDFAFGLSWTYGSVTLLNNTNPDVSNFKALPAGLAQSGHSILDLGVINIPPIKTPTAMTTGTFTLKIFERWVGGDTTISSGLLVGWYLDAVFLLPIDFGANYLTKTSATNIILLDAWSNPRRTWLINASDVVLSAPAVHRGSTPELHPDGTRVYFACMDSNDPTITDGWTVSTKYRPRFLEVRGA